MSSDGIGTIEDDILTILDAEGRGGMKIGELLARVQDDKLWQGANADDGEAVKSFEHWMRVRADEWRNKGVEASVGSFKRWLSHYRIFHRGLGLDFDQMRRLGVANMDEVRKVIDYDEKQHEIRAGDGTKLGRERARQLVDTLLEEQIENGSTFFQATREMVEDLLGRIPRKLEVIAEEIDGRYYVRDLVIWQGGSAARPMEGIDEDTIRWLTKKYNAKLTLRETSPKGGTPRGMPFLMLGPIEESLRTTTR